MRLDKFLKISRIIKRRSVANEACDTEHVTVNGRRAKASYEVKEGDIVEITFGQRSLKFRVKSVKEFVKKLEPETKQGDDIPESELCPKCHCGRIKVIKKGVAINGNPYMSFACSNEKYGCDYLETKFVNLNTTHRTSRKRKGY